MPGHSGSEQSRLRAYHQGTFLLVAIIAQVSLRGACLQRITISKVNVYSIREISRESQIRGAILLQSLDLVVCKGPGQRNLDGPTNESSCRDLRWIVELREAFHVFVVGQQASNKLQPLCIAVRGS